MDKKELQRIIIISKKPRTPVKQKHSYGNSYNKICSRSCYRINKVQQWTYCECIEKARRKAKQNPDTALIC